MSWSERLVRNHRQQTDCAIHQAYSRLASNPLALEKFHEMLHHARKRAIGLFEAPILDGRHLGVDALIHLARFESEHIRPVTAWVGTSSSWRPSVSLFARHLVCEYNIPAFLASSWYSKDVTADRKRQWFVAHGRGSSFRSLNLPMVMTRRMESIFLASHDHLTIEHAMRKAELLALGAPADLVQTIMSTPLATDLRHWEFWRTFWVFLIQNLADVDPNQIGPMIDYVQAVRHDQIIVEAPEGRVRIGPPQPEFAMKGRTVQSMLRLMRDWHRGLGESTATAVSWKRSPFEPLLLVEPSQDASETPKRWHMMELTNSAQLRTEGSTLHHCVASYTDRCCRGLSSIWSLRLWNGEKVRHVLTIEVDPKRRTVIQARGRANRAASGKPLRLLQEWTTRERLQMSI